MSSQANRVGIRHSTWPTEDAIKLTDFCLHSETELRNIRTFWLWFLRKKKQKDSVREENIMSALPGRSR
jgi:hypothetical protein